MIPPKPLQFTSFAKTLEVNLQDIIIFSDEFSTSIANEYLEAENRKINREGINNTYTAACLNLLPFGFFTFTKIKLCTYLYQGILLEKIKYIGKNSALLTEFIENYTSYEDYLIKQLNFGSHDYSLLVAYDALKAFYHAYFNNVYDESLRSTLLFLENKSRELLNEVARISGQINPIEACNFLMQKPVGQELIPKENLEFLNQQKEQSIEQEKINNSSASNSQTKKRRLPVTQKTVAKLCDVEVLTVKNWDKGKSTPPHYPGRHSLIHIKTFSETYKTDKAIKREARNIKNASSSSQIENYAQDDSD